MRVLFSVPRYHPNHDGMVIGLLQAGHSVAFLVHRRHRTEKYVESVDVYEAKPAAISFLSRRLAKNEREKIKATWPSIGNLIKIFRAAKPNIVIARNMNPTNYLIYLISVLFSIRYILYVQDRTGYERIRARARLLLRLGLWPRHTINTTQSVTSFQVEGKTFDFIPFAVEPYSYEKRLYTGALPIRIVAVGKFDIPNKQNKELVRALSAYLRRGDIVVTIAGLRSHDTSQIYQELLKEIVAQGVSDMVTLKENLSYEETRELYCDNDLFILASTREMAGISPVEAMATGLPVISSNNNGTAYFVRHDENGFLFEDKNFDDLIRYVKFFIDNPDQIETMGRRAREMMLKHYSPADFARRMEDIVARRFPALPASADRRT